MRTLRWRWSAPIALLMSLTIAGQAAAAVSWATATKVGPQYGWNNGGYGLTRSATSSASYLNAIYTTDYVNNQFVSDAGPNYQGVYATRRSVTGTTWTTPVRLNPTTEHGARGAVAGSGAYVFAVYSKVGSYENYDPLAPRPLYLRYSTNAGSSFNPATPVSPDTCPAGGECVPARADFPSIAAVGARYHLAYVDGNTGNVHLLTRNVTQPGGFGTILGTTTAESSEGDYSGVAAVAAAGNNVIVSWIADNAGKLVARVSRDGGATFGAQVMLATSGAGTPHAAGLGSRLAVTWDGPSNIFVRVWKSGTWQARRTVTTFSSTGTYKGGYAPAVGLVGTAQLGVSWSDCRRINCDAVSSSTAGVDVSWRESTTDGSTWKTKVVLANSTSAAARRVSDGPSVVYTSSSKRYVLYNTASWNFSTSQLYLRTGSGTP